MTTKRKIGDHAKAFIILGVLLVLALLCWLMSFLVPSLLFYAKLFGTLGTLLGLIIVFAFCFEPGREQLDRMGRVRVDRRGRPRRAPSWLGILFACWLTFIGVSMVLFTILLLCGVPESIATVAPPWIKLGWIPVLLVFWPIYSKHMQSGR